MFQEKKLPAILRGAFLYNTKKDPPAKASGSCIHAENQSIAFLIAAISSS